MCGCVYAQWLGKDTPLPRLCSVWAVKWQRAAVLPRDYGAVAGEDCGLGLVGRVTKRFFVSAD
jgi:hypothetical protein